MGRLTKTAICSRALEIVGNTAILTRAELWADLLLDAIARESRWPELQKQHSAAIASGASTLAYPTDYGYLLYSADIPGVGVFQDSTGGRSPLRQLQSGAARSNVSHTTDGAGTPLYVGDDRVNSRWILHPISNVAGTIYLEYHSVPAAIASAGTPWYPNDLALVNALVELAERHERGNLTNLDLAIKEQSRKLVLSSPSRLQLFTNGGPGDGLDPRWFGSGGYGDSKG